MFDIENASFWNFSLGLENGKTDTCRYSRKIPGKV